MRQVPGEAPEPDERLLARAGSDPVELIVSDGLVEYPRALAFMDERAAAIRAGTARECLWLLQHPPLYTAGTSAVADDLLAPDRFPVFRTGRGGQYTYHGPGQRIAYVMLDLERRRQDIRRYVRALEAWLILALAGVGVKGERREGRVGIWVDRPVLPGPVLPGPVLAGPGLAGPSLAQDKVAAIGVRVRRWVTLHGVALNICPDLEHFSGIVPCGISGHGVTSLAALGASASLSEADRALTAAFRAVFGPLDSQAGPG